MQKKEGMGSFLSNRKGQVTLFIIIAVLVVGGVALYFFLLPSTQTTAMQFDETDPQGFMQTCLEDPIIDVVETVSLQGGDVNPTNYISYEGTNIRYLCYTNEFLTECVVQQPLLKQHIESEVENEIRDDVEFCFNSLRENYEQRNYDVQLETGRTNFEILPERVVARMDYVLTVTRANTERFEEFNVVLNNNLYELVSIANSIIDLEASYGDAETSFYETLYRDLDVDKHNQQDGSTIYILTNRNSGDKFQFASRSIARGPGFN